MTGENTIIAPSLEQLWQRSHAGARAGTGFRFQDAAAMAAAVYDLSFKGIRIELRSECTQNMVLEDCALFGTDRELCGCPSA